MNIENTTKTMLICILENAHNKEFYLYSYGILIAKVKYKELTDSVIVICNGLYSTTTRKHISKLAKIVTEKTGVKLTFQAFKLSALYEHIIIISK